MAAACAVARDAGVCATLGAVPAAVPMRVVHDAFVCVELACTRSSFLHFVSVWTRKDHEKRLV